MSVTREELSYRSVTRVDDAWSLDSVAPMHLCSWRHTHAGSDPPYIVRTRHTTLSFLDEYRRLIAEDGFSILIAELSGAAVGIAIFRCAGGRGWIEGFDIALERRREGRGTELLDETLSRIPEPIVGLQCLGRNTVGQNFWSANGFIPRDAEGLGEGSEGGAERMSTIEYELNRSNRNRSSQNRSAKIELTKW